MGGFKLEYSRRAYRVDFAVYGLLVVTLAVWLAAFAPATMRWRLVLWVVAGGAIWTLIEYLLHRFLLHAVQPFARWHGEHHRRPMALIGTPTVWSVTWLLAGVFVPLLCVVDRWHAGAVTLGVVGGYFGYSVVHHAIHHSSLHSAWLERRRRLHQIHHRGRAAGCYGVTTGFWDEVFATAPRPIDLGTPAKSTGDA